MRNTHGWRVLEERKDYIIMYNQYTHLNCYGNFQHIISVSLMDKETETLYLEEKAFISKNIPTTQKEEEKILKKMVKILLKRWKKGRK